MKVTCCSATARAAGVLMTMTGPFMLGLGFTNSQGGGATSSPHVATA
jgi:hypothetical protein